MERHNESNTPASKRNAIILIDSERNKLKYNKTEKIKHFITDGAS